MEGSQINEGEEISIVEEETIIGGAIRTVEVQVLSGPLATLQMNQKL